MKIRPPIHIVWSTDEVDLADPFQRKMKNVEMTVVGDTLIIKVDLSKDFSQSKSGKTLIVATTEGNASVPGRNEALAWLRAKTGEAEGPDGTIGWWRRKPAERSHANGQEHVVPLFGRGSKPSHDALHFIGGCVKR